MKRFLYECWLRLLNEFKLYKFLYGLEKNESLKDFDKIVENRLKLFDESIKKSEPEIEEKTDQEMNDCFTNYYTPKEQIIRDYCKSILGKNNIYDVEIRIASKMDSANYQIYFIRNNRILTYELYYHDFDISQNHILESINHMLKTYIKEIKHYENEGIKFKDE